MIQYLVSTVPQLVLFLLLVRKFFGDRLMIILQSLVGLL